MATWSGQPEEISWHWCTDTYQKLGNVIWLLSFGTADCRNKAYSEYMELRRWFVPEEFNIYIEKLDTFRESKGAKPLRDIIEEIHREKRPATGWKALDGDEYSDIALDEVTIAMNYQKYLERQVDKITQPAQVNVESVKKAPEPVTAPVPAPASAQKVKSMVTLEQLREQLKSLPKNKIRKQVVPDAEQLTLL